MEAAGWDELARQLGAAGPRDPTRRWRRRRAAAFGPAIDPLFYAEPIEVAARRGRLDHRHRRPHLPRRLQQRARASGTPTRG